MNLPLTPPILVLGAGIVGVSTALALQARGQRVILLDRKPPGSETSYGNAGIIALSSLIPFNTPRLFASLPALLMKKSLGFRYQPAYLLREAGNFAQFLWHARPSSTAERIKALHALILHTHQLHPEWLQAAGQSARLRNTGWLKLYRSVASFKAAAADRAILDAYAIRYQVLDKPQIQALEPTLQPVFERALWLQDINSVDNPGAVTRAYADLFVARGGELQTLDVTQAKQTGQGWQLIMDNGNTLEGAQLVVALGPWSKDFLAKLDLKPGIKLPMLFERGGHRHFQPEQGHSITRPIYDVSGGYVLTPMETGLRLTCGVELNQQAADYSPEQLDGSEQVARGIMELGARQAPDWMGCRPTLPDALPAIGATRQPGLWLNTGHQHIGFSTGPASGELLADLLTGQKTAFDSTPYAPGRFGI